MQDARCKPDVRVFRWPDSVLGARCSVLGVNPVPGIRCQAPGSWYPTPGTRDLAECLAHALKTRTPGMQRGRRLGMIVPLNLTSGLGSGKDLPRRLVLLLEGRSDEGEWLRCGFR
jgi:hypothetical protein